MSIHWTKLSKKLVSILNVKADACKIEQLLSNQNILSFYLFSIKEIGRFQVMLIIFSGFSVMGASLENLSIGYVMPSAKCDLNLTPSQQGRVGIK